MSTVNRASNSKLLHPQLGAGHVHRERLIDILHNNIQMRLQVVSAPAGYGKSSLLADFVHGIDVPVCWYSIDGDDEDPKLLLEGILTSISSQFDSFGRLTASRLAATSEVMKDAPHLLTILANEVNSAVPDYLIFVLEDYHVIEHSEQAKDILNLLLEKIPENFHLIISSRTQVELPVISRLVVRNQASILTASHLSFTAPEAQALVSACFGRNLSTEEAGKLVEETGGWAIGMMLHLNSMSTTGLAKLPEITQCQVSRYMTTEVFEKQSPEIQYFLLASSTIDEMEFELLEQLIPGANCRKLMSDLERQNLFLQCVDKKAGRYRYHQLFRDFLQEKIRQDDPTRFMLLHFKAASLYEHEHRWAEAVAHYHGARRYQEIARIVKDVGSDLLKAGKWTLIRRWLNLLPIDLRVIDPELVLLDVECLVHLGNTDEAARLLANLLGKLSDEDWLLKAKALSWRGAVFRLTGSFQEAKTDVSTAIRLLDEHHGPADLLGACHRRLGDIHKDRGQFPSALRHLRLAQKYYTSVFDIGPLASTHNSLGVIYKRLGELSRAKMHFEKARAGWVKVDNAGALAATLNNIGLIHQRLGQYDLALDVFHAGLKKAKETGYRRIEAIIKISTADALRELNDFDNALRDYTEGIELARQSNEPTFIAHATAGIGETYRLLRHFDKARTLLEEARYQAEDQKQPYEIALFDVQLGIIDYETGQLARARARLTDAGKRLQAMGDRDALAKVYFHLAQASFLSRDYNAAVEWLEKTSKLADELGYDYFLVIEGRKAIPLVQYGVTLGIGNGRFIRVVERIRALNGKKQHQDITDVPNGPDSKTEHDIEVRALGHAEVTVNNRQVKDIDWRSNRAKEIFFYLVTHLDGKTRDQITAALWPDLSPAKGSSNFHINLFRARHALFPGVFTQENGRYRANPDIRIWFDVAEFERLTSVARKQSEKNHTDLERAVELYTGPFLAEFYTDWVEVHRRELENTYLRALSLLADRYARDGDINKAVALLEKSITVDPYQEYTYYRIMRLYVSSKNEPLALRAYRQYLKTVASEKGLALSPEIRDLYRKILGSKASSNRQN